MTQLLLLAGAVLLALLAPMYWLRIHRRDRGVRRAWREAAQGLGLACELPRGRSWPNLIGRIDGLEVSVEVEVGWLTLPDEAWTVAHVRDAGLVGLRLFNAAAAPLLQARPGATSSASFGREFDPAFTVIGAPDLLRARLDGEARRRCMALASEAVVVDSGLLLVGRAGVLDEPATLQALVRDAVGLAAALVAPQDIDEGLEGVARTDDNWQNRRSALGLLFERSPARGRALAPDLLGDSAPEVALEAALTLEDQPSLRALVDREDGSTAVRLRALEALAGAGIPDLGSAAVSLIMDTDAELVERALELIRRAAPRDLAMVLPPLVPLLEERDHIDPQGQWDRVARSLAACLATTGSPEVEAALVRLSTHFGGSTRQAAVLALGMVGTVSSMPLLLRLRDAGAGRAAQRALADIEARAAGAQAVLTVGDIERVMDPITVRRTPGVAPARARST